MTILTRLCGICFFILIEISRQSSFICTYEVSSRNFILRSINTVSPLILELKNSNSSYLSLNFAKTLRIFICSFSGSVRSVRISTDFFILKTAKTKNVHTSTIHIIGEKYHDARYPRNIQHTKIDTSVTASNAKHLTAEWNLAFAI